MRIGRPALWPSIGLSYFEYKTVTQSAGQMPAFVFCKKSHFAAKTKAADREGSTEQPPQRLCLPRPRTIW